MDTVISLSMICPTPNFADFRYLAIRMPICYRKSSNSSVSRFVIVITLCIHRLVNILLIGWLIAIIVTFCYNIGYTSHFTLFQFCFVQIVFMYVLVMACHIKGHSILRLNSWYSQYCNLNFCLVKMTFYDQFIAYF